MTDADIISFTLHCRTCGARLTKPLSALPENAALSITDGSPLLPTGRFTPSETVLTSGEEFYGVTPGSILINTGDLDGAHSAVINMGCCGPSGEKPDLLCPAGHTVGTEVGDCWQPHFCHFPLEWISVQPDGKPSGSSA